MQGPDPNRLKASACLKHYVAYSLENSSRFAHGRPLTPYVDRHHFNAIVTEQDLEDTYLPPFQSGVAVGNASGLMCSCESDPFLVDFVRLR